MTADLRYAAGPPRACRVCGGTYAPGRYGVHRREHPEATYTYAGWASRVGPVRSSLAERNVEIGALVAAGRLTLDEIGLRYGLTRERIRQVAEREGISREHIAVPNRPRFVRRRKCRLCSKPIPVGQMRAHFREVNHAHRRLRASDITALRSVFERGLGYHAIADVLGVDPMSVRYHVRRMGLRPHRTGRLPGVGPVQIAALRAELAEAVAA